jgi:hypothetical protein
LSYDASFPEKLYWLEIGFSISRLSQSLIPGDIKYLKLLGGHFKNDNIENVNLFIDIVLFTCSLEIGC